jgi:2-polyprenyl-6-methoxyphenol hydroxylase-like FAD-dependent oxidoreductase
MTHSWYDAIVVGARCAGSPTAMLLARQGYRVLLVDRASFPSDTVSTHIVHPPGIASLRDWGLLDRLTATGCPPIHTYAFDFGPFTLAGAPGTEQTPVAYAPRRTVLDKLLVDAAAEAGAEVRERFTVDELVVDDGKVTGIRGHTADGARITEHARVVVGADGRHSLVARIVEPEQYDEKPQLLAGYYAYFSDLPMDGRFEVYVRENRAFAAWPTHDDLTVVIGGWPIAEFEANRTDIEGNFLKMLQLAPAFADRVGGATRQTRFVGTAVPNYFRQPYGPGWALVGDAGYNRDFITGQGIHDAFRDAQSCVSALDEAWRGVRSYDEAMAAYQSARDAQVLPMYHLTTDLATLQPPPPELAQLLAAAAGNQAAMDGFARVNAGVLSPAEYFSEANAGRILAAASA